MAKHNKQDWTKQSEFHCHSCGKPLKQNLIDKIPDAKYCYTCWSFIIRGKIGRSVTKTLIDKGLKVKKKVFIKLETIIKENIRKYGSYTKKSRKLNRPR